MNAKRVSYILIHLQDIGVSIYNHKKNLFTFFSSAILTPI